MEKAFFVYAWDLIAEGPENALGKIQDLGANTICLASSYHAGKFTRPRTASGKILFPDDGSAAPVVCTPLARLLAATVARLR